MTTSSTWAEIATLILNDPSNKRLQNLKKKIDEYHENLEF